MVRRDRRRLVGNLPSYRERRDPYRGSPTIPKFVRCARCGRTTPRAPSRLPGHVFWPDDLSLVDSDIVDAARIATSAQVTDTYLLALAAANNGQLATLDRRLSPAPVRGGRAALHLIHSAG